MSKQFLKDIAYEKIKERILQGYYEEGSTSENELVKELQMSRTPIREALQRLQYDGLVKIYSNQGVFFQDLSVKQVNDLFDMRIAIETFSLRKAVPVITSGQLEKLEQELIKQQKALDEQDPMAFMKNDAAFHSYLIGLADNQFIDPAFKNIRERLFHHGSLVYKKNPDLLRQSLQEHRSIVEAIQANDVKAATWAMETHLENSKKIELSCV
ncbi:GntR family transcriptional regulator [Brevibacillus reuszeri]|uniref:GntR family transcriptional regulator n=1 Tax=Brevibacillus reuszeri TaxID=54915 RepID=UPI001B1EABED|nr:GntR family transcriptional regulator [Brevibacillus reuszeri]GIO08203.1 GntR family transcriptional regulator [Brevibacillus reuszeri]